MPLTVAELIALPYPGPNSFQRGMRAEDFRREYRNHGQVIRWFKAFNASDYNPGTDIYNRSPHAGRDKNGRIYIEQTYCADGATLVSAVKVMPYRTTQDIEDAEFGLLPIGSSAISVMPDEIPLMRLDRVIMVQKLLRARPLLVRSTVSGLDALPFNPVVSIVRVWQDTTVYLDGVDYELSGNDSDGYSVSWLNGAQPIPGSGYAAEIVYQPTFTCLGAGHQIPPVDSEGVSLPLITALVLTATN